MTIATVVSDTTNPSSGPLGAGDVLTFTIAMSEVVTVSGTPTLTLNDGGTATYVSGSGTANLVFNYTVADGQYTTNLAVTGVALNGASVTDGAGNSANLSGATKPLAAPLVVHPVVVTAITAVPSVSGLLVAGQSVRFTATTSEAVTVSGTPTLTLNDGGIATYVSGSGTDNLVFNYTVATTQNTGDLQVTGLNQNGGQVTVAGSLSFAAATSLAAVGGKPQSMTTADLTGNGVQDLIVADFNGVVDVLLGNGSGAFGAATSYAAGSYPVSVTTADLAGNGVQDLIVADELGGVDVLLGNGSGGFGAATSYATGAYPVSVTTADLTGNGVQDLIVKDGYGNVDVLLGNGSGGFGAATSYAAAAVPDYIAAAAPNYIKTADFIGNGVQDIFGGTNGALWVQLGNGSGGFGATTTYATATNPAAVTTADLTGDGLQNLIFVDSNGGVNVLLNTSVQAGVLDPASFAAAVGANTGLVVDTITPVVMEVTASPDSGMLEAGAVITLNLALNEAVTVTSGTPTLTLNDGGTATYVSGSGTAKLVFSTTVTTGQHTTDLAVTGVVLNGASITDSIGNPANLSGALMPLAAPVIVIPVAVPAITAVPSGTGPLVAGQSVSFTVTTNEALTVSGTPTLTLNDGGIATYVSGSGTGNLVFNYTVAAGQTTGDLQVTGLNLNGGNVTVPGSLSFAAATSLAAVGGKPQSVTTADLTGNGVQDLIVADFNGGVEVLLGNGSGGFGAATSYAAGTHPASVTTADLTGNGVQDLVVADRGGGVDVLLGNGSGGFGAATNYAAGATPISVTTADLAGNGVQDLIVADELGGVDVLLGNGSGGFGAATSYAAGAYPVSVTTADLTGNGVQDLIVANFGGGVDVLLGNGSGSFGAATSYAAGASPVSVTTADLTGNGVQDLVVANNGGVDVLLGNGSGGFGAATSYAAGAYPVFVKTADLTGNGVQGLIVATNAGVEVLLNTSAQAGVFDPATTATGTNTGLVIRAAITADTATPATGDDTIGQVISFTLTANAAVFVTGAPTLTLNDGGTATYVSGSGTTSLVFSTTVAAGQNAATLAVTGVGLSGASITDGAGNAADLTGANTSFIGLQIDAVMPVVTKVTAAPESGVLGAGAVITLNLALNKAVTITAGTPTLLLNDGGTATYVSGSGTADLVFNYTVAAGQHTADLAITGVALNGASVTDGADNKAILSGAVTPLAASISVNPVVVTAITAVPSVSGPLVVGQSVSFTVTTNEAVTVSGTPTLTLNDGGVATYVFGSGTGNLVFNYTVAAGQTTGNLQVAGLNLNGGSVTVPDSLSFATATNSGATSYAVGTHPISVTTADLTGNGVQDLIVGYFKAGGGGGEEVLLGNGSGGFGAATSYAVGDPHAVTTADLTGNGVQDLIVADFGGAVEVLLGNGSGGFGPATSYAVGGHLWSVTTADLTGNGVQDLIVADELGGVDVLLGNGSGGFGAATSYVVGPAASAVTTADLTGNGVQDLIVADEYGLGGQGGGVDVLLGNGSGGFGTAISYATGGYADAVTTADLTGNGVQDLIVADRAGGVEVLLGNGSGGFGTATSYAAGKSSSSVTTADLTGNGVQDLIVTDFYGGVEVLLGNGSGGFSTATSYAAGAYPQSVTTADLTGNGMQDIIVANLGGGVDVLRNTSTQAGVFDPTSAAGANTGLVVGTLLCYLRGTHILTPGGEILIENLRAGNAVVTRFGGIQKIKWIGRQSFDARFIKQNRMPVCISAEAFDTNMPSRDLYVSPDHSMLLDGQLVLASVLVNGVTITQDWSPAAVEYFQIDLGIHDCVIAEGTWSETFADAPGMRDAFHNAADYAQLFPDHAPAEELSLCAIRPHRGSKLDAVLRPVVARAAARIQPGPLQGYIDEAAAPWVIRGWAYEADHPQLPVLLEVLLEDKVVATVLACHYRGDLLDAGMGTGHCAFDIISPVRLSPQTLRTLRIRRASDHAQIGRAYPLTETRAISELRLVATAPPVSLPMQALKQSRFF